MYEKAFVEVDEIINKMHEKDVKKIDPKFLKAIKENKDLSYNFEYDNSKTLIEQNLLEETESILLYMYIKYFATAEEKERIKKEVYEDYKIQKMKKGDSNI